MNGAGPPQEATVFADAVATRGPLTPPLEEVLEALRAKTRPLLLQRMRVLLFVILGSYVFFTVQDVLFFGDRVMPLMLIKVVQFITVGTLLWMIWSDRVPGDAVAFAVVAAAVLCFFATLAAVVRDNTTGTPLLLIIVAVGTATAIPWGVRGQAALVATSAALLAWNGYAVDGSLVPMLGNPSSGMMLTAGLVSLFVAHGVELRRREVEEREMGLRLREEYFRALLENGDDLIVVVDADGSVRYVSPAVQRILGWAPRAWMGRSLFDFVHPDDTTRLREAMTTREPRTGPARSVEVRFHDSSQSWHILDGAIADLLDDTAVQGFVFNARDVTQRRQTEGELRRSEAVLSALFESTNDPVWSVDRELKIVAMNRALRTSYAAAFDATLHIGQSLDERAQSGHLETWRELYDRVLSGESVTTELRLEDGGEARHYLISLCPIREGEEITGATAFSREITDLRRTEEMARRNQAELTHVLRIGTMGEMASALAHEINQPLAAISNYAGACVRRLDGGAEPPAELRRGLEQIAAEALRAGRIIRALRDLCRKGDGAMEMVDLNEVVHRSVELMRPQASMQAIALRLQTAANLPRIYADGVQIGQVVLNLLLNGIESMQGSRRKILSVSTARFGARVEVSVRDTGIGLDPTAGDRVFDPFFTTKRTGLGMGLAISRRIVEAHGGLLRGTGEPGGGSTFSFTLPLPGSPSLAVSTIVEPDNLRAKAVSS